MIIINIMDEGIQFSPEFALECLIMLERLMRHTILYIDTSTNKIYNNQTKI